MKKILIIFLCGQLLIFSYMFNKSVYEIYGLINIGDTSLKEYTLVNGNFDNKSKLYDYLESNKKKVQVLKTPMTNDNSVTYEIYHNHVDSILKYISISDNNYEYYDLNKEEFVDNTGRFYTNLLTEEIKYFKKLGIVIQEQEIKSNLSYNEIIKNNKINFIMLFITTQIIMIMYTYSKSKENAIKKLLGHSPVSIILSRIKEVLYIEGFSAILVIILNVSYFTYINKISIMYVEYLVIFLLLIIMTNILLILLTQRLVKNINIINSIKNKLFSRSMNNIIKITKIIMIFAVTISISMSINYLEELRDVYIKISSYSILRNLYTSYGVNADEAEKMRNNNQVIEVSDKVKELYLTNKKNAFVMDEGLSEMSAFGNSLDVSKEEMMNSYKYNYIILNKNYLKTYTDVPIKKGEIIGPTILVPQKYKNNEEKIKEYFKIRYEELVNYNKNYDDSIPYEEVDNLDIIYIENGYKYKILSSIQYEEETDIELIDSIIIVDNALFGSSYYYNILSTTQLAFKLDSRETFSSMLEKRQLDEMFYSYTLAAPFEIQISNYKFLIEQSLIFVSLFIITLIFIMYISDYIEVNVNSKRYAIKHVLGYNKFLILKENIIIIFILLIGGIILNLINVNIIAYTVFIVIDIIFLIYFYRKLIISDVNKVLNGGC